MTLESAALGNLIQILLLIVTGVGAALIVKQLRDARLTSQMETVLKLDEQHKEIVEASLLLSDFKKSANWESLSESEKVGRFESKEDLRMAWRKIASYYETIGLLVKLGTLDEDVAYG